MGAAFRDWVRLARHAGTQDVDDYDPGNPEYVIPISEAEARCARTQALEKQIAKLEAYLMKRRDAAKTDVFAHYEEVLAELRYDVAQHEPSPHECAVSSLGSAKPSSASPLLPWAEPSVSAPKEKRERLLDVFPEVEQNEFSSPKRVASGSLAQIGTRFLHSDQYMKSRTLVRGLVQIAVMSVGTWTLQNILAMAPSESASLTTAATAATQFVLV